MTGIVGLFIPFSHTIDLLYAIGGTILFSGYIVYDTYLINNRLSPDEYIMAAISLYLEYVRILSSHFPPANACCDFRGVALSTSVRLPARFCFYDVLTSPPYSLEHPAPPQQSPERLVNAEWYGVPNL